jgi:hypothetical protein
VTTYWFVRELFRFAPELYEQSPRWYAAWAAIFLTFSYWHLSLSRVGFRAITLPLALTIAFALFWRVWRRLRESGGIPWRLAVLGGLALSLPLYTYTAGRMAPLLFAITVAVTWLLANRFAIDRALLLKTAGVMALAALAGALPLLIYFAQHPAAFGTHALEVSVLNTQYAGDNPLLALLASTARSLLLFGVLPDGNLRHNPAGIPVFTPLLAAWLLVGVGLAIYFWRRLTTFFALAWLLLLAAPAILSSEGVPHSLRMIGMLPVVYVLPVLAMGWAAGRAPRRWQPGLRWLPLPFLLVAATVGITSYFGAWSPIERFRGAFRTDYADFARTLAASDSAETLWVLPLVDADALTDGKFSTIDFFQRDPGAFATLPVDEATAAAELERLTAGRRFVNVLRPGDAPDLQETAWLFADVKGLFDLLLRRNSTGAPAVDRELAGIPYRAYELDDARSFALPPTEQAITDTVFGDTAFGDAPAGDPGAGAAFRLTGVNLGGGNRWSAHGGELALPADAPLWVVLRWAADPTVATMHKTSLVLRDADGRVAAQADGLLVGDRQPGVLESTYQVIELPPGTAPGRYTLELRVYAEASGRSYPVTQAGQRAAFLPLAAVTVAPQQQPGALLSPQFALDPAQTPPDFQITGYDLPARQLAPGDALPLTLYFSAPVTPTVDYTVSVRLAAADGGSAAQSTLTPGGDAFPPTAWRAGETLRIPASLSIDPAAATGAHRLHVTVYAGAEPVADFDLGEIEISGRPRLLAAPPIDQPGAASFGEVVRLAGVNAAPAMTATPGAPIRLTLIWQPITTGERPLVRFVQVLDASGQLVAQQDTVPCEGACPATAWLAGEYLLDPVEVMLPAETPAGEYRLIAGWYDADSQQRLRGIDATGNRLENDVVVLPVTIDVGE